ncbi:hypothetical protein ACH429_18545 [Streptomyces pathocidini]|uniref:Integrase n=1 Tax=Streptomyces pathocidini TaxID=1650571 RepID=A0ABW7UVY5_9ACTN
MAYIVERPRGDGQFTYQVKWRGGARSGKGESEKFGDRPSAETFKKLAYAHSQQWPHGWVKGQGFVEQPAAPGDMPFQTWAERYIDRLAGIDDRPREDYRRERRLHFPSSSTPSRPQQRPRVAYG